MLWPRRLIPSLQKLAAFEAAARYGSFSLAAGELALTQSAVSKQIQQLEEALGVVLFEREKRRIILTEAGKALHVSALDLLERASSATHTVMASAGSTGVLSIGSLPTFAARWLIPRLPRFRDTHPQVLVNVRTRVEPFDLEEAGVDVAIHYGGPAWPNSEMIPLLHEVVVPVASSDYRNVHALHRPSDLQKANLLQMATRPHAWADWFAMIGAPFDYPLRGALFDQFSCTAAAAAAGWGVALLPRFLIDAELRSGALVVLFEHGVRSTGSYYAVVPFAKRHQPPVASFVKWLKAETATQGGPFPQSEPCAAEGPNPSKRHDQRPGGRSRMAPDRTPDRTMEQE